MAHLIASEVVAGRWTVGQLHDASGHQVYAYVGEPGLYAPARALPRMFVISRPLERRTAAELRRRVIVEIARHDRPTEIRRLVIDWR